MNADKKKSSKRRSLENGRDLLARYKAIHQNMESKQSGEPSDDDLMQNDTAEQSLDQHSLIMTEDASFKDTTQSSVSVSEGEGDGDVESMAGRVAELKEVMHGQQAMIQMLNAEFEHMRDEEAGSPSSSRSQNSSTQYKDLVQTYKCKLKDFDQAVTKRDTLISSLHESLEQALSDRDSLKIQLSALRAIYVTPQEIDGPIDIQIRITDLEQALGTHVEIVKSLNSQISESQDYIKKLESEKNQHEEETNVFKNVIHHLNEKIHSDVTESSKLRQETEEMQKQCQETVAKIQKDMAIIIDKFTNETKSKAVFHEKEMQEIQSKHEAEVAQIKANYEEQYKSLFERYNTELPELESKHAKELQVFQAQSIAYKKKVEALECDLDNQNKSYHLITTELNSVKRQCREDKDMMREQISLHKVQIDELTAKYVAASSVLNSRESIERSLEEALINVESLKRENDNFKLQYDEISAKYAAIQALLENPSIHERSMNHKGEIDKSLSRFSGMSLSEFNTTTYHTFDDAGIQYQIVKQRLDEKESLEQKLMNRISELEEASKKMHKELEEANMEKKSYEKELKETKNKCEKMMSELKIIKESNREPLPFQSNIYFSDDKISKDLPRQDENRSENEKQIETLKQIIQQKDLQCSEMDNKLEDALQKVKEYKFKCEHLGGGLKNAWEQCAAFGEKLDHTLGINDTKLDDSHNQISFAYNSDLVGLQTDKSFNDKLAICHDKSVDSPFSGQSSQNLETFGKKLDYFHTRIEIIDLENQRLKEENAKLLLMKAEFDNIKVELEKRHTREMEELRTYFEEKCVQMEKQYSEEVFSQQSKKMSDDSDAEEMADDLYYGGGGDCISINRESGDNPKVGMDLQIRNNGLEDINRNSFFTANQLCQTEWDTAVENGELIELRAAYSHQLEEQIALAKRDIVNALQEQIQALIIVEADTEDNWPPELLELRNKFTNNAKRELEKLKEAHAVEISLLKDEHSRNLAKTIESYQEKLHKLALDIACTENKHIDSLMGDKDVIKQRDNLYQACVLLKGIVHELIKYFVSCEEELNNTLIFEVLRRQLDDNADLSDLLKHVELGKIGDSLLQLPTSPKIKIKRVHFALQPSQITAILNKSSNIFDLIEDKSELIRDLRVELEKGLARLKNESAQLFGLNLSPGESILDALSKQIACTAKINEELTSKLLDAEGMIDQYEEESQELKMKIMELQQKLIAMDCSKEIISEGYGEQDSMERESIEDFTQLHEKARMAIMSGAGDNSYLLQLIEELCRHHDKQAEEIKKEKEDLQQQIEAADKQLRSTRKFLEEQATEREIERDDSARQIQALKDQLKDRDREKERDLRITSEHSLLPKPTAITPSPPVSNRVADVEVLENQMREISTILAESQKQKGHYETEYKSAVDKIWELREIIRGLEGQIETSVRREEVLTDQVEKLNEMLLFQSHHQEELKASKIDGEGELNEHITHLEEELLRHKLSSEHFNVNSTALKQMKSELHDMFNHLDKKTKELEALHMCGSNLSISQPSEDVSIRDQIDATRCPSPDDPNGPPTLPLDQLLKLKEKLMKHSRAEEVAFKRIKDLDMQLSTLKIQNEMLQAEQEILQQHNSEQLFQIETMRGRLEQQKQSAPFVQRQATSKLELQLHEANAKFQALEQALANKDVTLKELTIDLERAGQLLKEKQEEILSVVHVENKTIQDLKDRIQILEQDNEVMESKLNTQERKNQDIPLLIDSMLADKNDEIDHLKEQLSKRDKQLEVLSLQIDDQCTKMNEPKNSARTLSDILSIPSECEEASEAIRDISKIMRDIPHNMSSSKFATLQMQCDDHLDTSPMPLSDPQRSRSPINIPPLELNSQPHSISSPHYVSHPQISLAADSIRSDADLKSPARRSTSSGTGSSSKRSRSSHSRKNDNIITPNRVHSQLVGSTPKASIEDLECQLKATHNELQTKSATLNKCEQELASLQKRFDELRVEYKDTLETLTRDKVFYQNQYEICQESESKIKRDLLEVENDLKIRSEELEVCKEKISSDERILYEMQTENCTLKKDIKKLRDENRTYQLTLREKIEELKNLKQIIFEKDITIETFKTRNVEIENENKQLYEFKTKYETTKKDLSEGQNEVRRLVDGINKRNELIEKLDETARRASLSSNCNSVSDKDQLIIHQQELLKEKDKEYRYSQDLIKEKDKEIHHLQEYIKEKDKVIKQMSDDSKSLQRSLETIQSKMKENGNVVELRKKLKEERVFNDELTKMVGKLKRELEVRDESLKHETEGTEIEDMVKRELNLSADLDKKLLDAIDNDVDKNSCHLLAKKPIEDDLDIIMHQYTDVRRKLKQASRINEKLTAEKNSLDIQQEILKSQVAEYENRILQIKADFEIECKTNVSLSRELSNQKAVIHRLEILLQEQLTKHNFSEQENSDIIKNLRLKLTSSLDSENELRNELAASRQQCKLLECKLKLLRESVSPEQAAVISTSPVLKEDEKNNLLLTQKYEMAAREIVELKDTLKGAANEKKRIEKQLEIELEEREKLLSNILLVTETKDHLEIELRRTKEELKGCNEDCEWLHKNMRIMSEAKEKEEAQQSSDQSELKDLRMEITNIKEVMKDLEADSEELKRQLALSQSEQNQLVVGIRTLRKVESDLQKKIIAAKKEEEKLKEVIADMQMELKRHCERELNLSKELLIESSEKNNNTHLIEKITELTSEIARYSSEKGMLHDKLIRAREESERYNMRVKELETLLTQSESNEGDSEALVKLQQLYAKYLRVDSKRKALVYQKRYLLCVIGGYQLSCDDAVCMIAKLTSSERSYVTEKTLNVITKCPKARFKTAGLVVIALCRIRWMVQRWKTGKRKGANFLGGNPTHSFMTVRPNSSPIPRAKRRPDNEYGAIDYDHYAQRFFTINKTLGLAMSEPETKPMPFKKQ